MKDEKVKDTQSATGDTAQEKGKNQLDQHVAAISL